MKILPNQSRKLRNKSILGIMVSRQEATYELQEGGVLKLNCKYDTVLLDLKYRNKKNGSTRNIYTKTGKQERDFELEYCN